LFVHLIIWSFIMSKSFVIAGAVVAMLAPAAAFAQQDNTQAGSGMATGAATGAVGGAVVGGPVGAAVGAVGGAIVGGIVGQSQPKFREYVVTQRVPSYSYAQPLQVGAVLPADGVTYYQVPAEYGATEYRYTVVNNTPVLVDPGTRRVVQIVQ
jgi:uncharacterized protein YcfJ